jgi:hypothetical protein
LSCARCHDHKFDPITARDYYGLYGIFSSTRYPWPGIELDKRQRDFVPLVPPSKLTELEEAQAARLKEQARLTNEIKKLKQSLTKATGADKPALEEKLKKAEHRAKEHLAQPALFETAYAVEDAKSCSDAPLQIKGDPARPGDGVRRHFPAVLGGSELPETCRESGRRELAKWVVDVDNPLPARVKANRIWSYHFGRGIVQTPNDFGKQGKPPTHPELLDYLATQFRDGDWSIKSLHRRIMLSRVYQQSSQRSAQALELDPANDWLAGFPRRRLDAESIRDTLLVLGGNLDLSPAGAHPFPAQGTWDFTQHKPFKAIYDTRRRSVYLMTQRIQRHPFQAVFDGADPSTSTAVRMTSTTPLQALFLLNDPLVHEQSRLMAERIMDSSSVTDARVAFAYELLFARPASADEVDAATDFLANAQELLRGANAAAGDIEAESWRAYVRALLRLNEFVYLD